ncbi:hypothetical protein [Nocardioides sp. W7]|uniref:hypothetical protein n=1 Tax=Nocardioides sp. W7 TaxID=2931390 RepID=UPI001FD5D6E1|nr:hypothetical protein [Nocardioides sp. W7]
MRSSIHAIVHLWGKDGPDRQGGRSVWPTRRTTRRGRAPSKGHPSSGGGSVAKSTILPLLLVAGALTASATLVPAQAAPARAEVTVTITAQGTDMSGVVKSPRPKRCAADRTVKVFKLVGGEPHLWATDTTDLQNGRYAWSTGNTGTEGRFFAKVARKAGCRGDVSPTIRVRRND